jgi:hypothetical protein
MANDNSDVFVSPLFIPFLAKELTLVTDILKGEEDRKVLLYVTQSITKYYQETKTKAKTETNFSALSVL